MMLINGFLGEVVGLRPILNEFSYNFALYGDPDPVAPWGWQLFGHHCAVNCLVVRGPDGAVARCSSAPNPTRSTKARTPASSFGDRIRLGTDLMAAAARRPAAGSDRYQQMVDPAMPPGRVHPGDERHLAGAFQDNRVIPLEGIRVADMPAAAQELVLGIVEPFVLPCRPARGPPGCAKSGNTSPTPGSPGSAATARATSSTTASSPRWSSPSSTTTAGSSSNYDTPQPFHIHTVLRTPNGNDYGRAYVRQWQQQTQEGQS